MSAPISREERTGLIDALRGFALFGVLVANLAIFTGYWGMPPEQAASLSTAGADKVVVMVIGALVTGRFVTLFSFLFGVGFAVYLERNDTRRWARRLAVMLVIGLAHSFLIWAGDILTTYAALGFLLLLFRKRTDRTLVNWAILFCATTMIGTSLRLLVVTHRPGAAAWALVHAPTFRAAIAENAQLWSTFWVTPALVGFLSTVLGRLLLGYAAGRRRLLQDAPAHLPFFRKLLVGSLFVAIPTIAFELVLQIFVERRTRGTPVAIPLSAIEELGMLSTAAVYLSGFVLLYQRPRFRRLVARLEHVGRMALTNYLGQSVVCTLIFYTWPGLGLAGTLGPTGTTVFAVGFFALQIVVSGAWLGRFRFGPVEWLWRSLTYGEVQPMRLAPSAVSQTSTDG